MEPAIDALLDMNSAQIQVHALNAKVYLHLGIATNARQVMDYNQEHVFPVNKVGMGSELDNV